MQFLRMCVFIQICFWYNWIHFSRYIEYVCFTSSILLDEPQYGVLIVDVAPFG